MRYSRKVRKKGFSLVELVLVLALGSIVMLSMTKWITGVGNVITTSITSNGKYDQDVAFSNMESELTSAVPCDEFGYRSPVISYDPNSKIFGFTTSKSYNGTKKYIQYKIDNDALYRSEVSVEGNCEFPETGSWSKIVSGIDSSNSQIGYIVKGIQEPNFLYISCVYIGDANCNITSLYIKLQSKKLEDPDIRVLSVGK